MHEMRDTLEDVVEPFLIQQGLVKRTQRGRMATDLAYRHFSLEPPHRTKQTGLLIVDESARLFRGYGCGRYCLSCQLS